MADWSLYDGGNKSETIGSSTADTFMKAVTASGSANTKGSWVELVDPSSFPASGILVNYGRSSALGLYLVDIAVGAAGSEKILIENLHYTAGDSVTGLYSIMLPLQIPSGTRISARVQSSVTSQSVHVGATLLSSGFLPSSPLSRATTYGADTSDSGGSQIDPGAVDDTKGAYTEIVSSTTNPIKLIYMVIGSQANQVYGGNYTWFVDIAVGAGSSEKLIYENLYMVASGAADQLEPRLIGPLSVNIPAGTRLAVRAQSSTTDATDRLFDVVLIGLD